MRTYTGVYKVKAYRTKDVMCVPNSCLSQVYFKEVSVPYTKITRKIFQSSDDKSAIRRAKELCPGSGKLVEIISGKPVKSRV